MVVETNAVAHPSTEQLIDRNAERLTLDIPEGLLDPGNGTHALDTSAPEILPGHDLVKVLNATRVFANNQATDIFDRTDDAGGLPL